MNEWMNEWMRERLLAFYNIIFFKFFFTLEKTMHLHGFPAAWFDSN